MKLKQLSYREHQGNDKYWELRPLHFGDINLIVGVNSSGKSRMLNVIANTAAHLSGEKPGIFNDGEPEFVFEDNRKHIRYAFKVKGRKVLSEEVIYKDKYLLQRDNVGNAKVYSEKTRRQLAYKTEIGQLAITTKSDEIQTPTLFDVIKWSRNLKHYIFSSDMGRNHLYTLKPDGNSNDNESEGDKTKLQLAQVVIEMQKLHDLKQSVINDMEYIGYNITDIGVVASNRVNAINPVLEVFVKEKNLQCRTLQVDMSLGMYRAFATIIYVNWIIANKSTGSVLIDDIGEGLDFDRASKLIDLLIRKAKGSSVQLIMATNDRFVMNKIDLQYWTILNRNGSIVKGVNILNAPNRFRLFRRMGLNNFEFFQRRLYLGHK